MLAPTLLAVLSTACGSVANPSPNGSRDAAADAPVPLPDAPPDAPAGTPLPAPTGVTLSRGTETGALGDLAGDLFSDACPAGQALTGITGTNGAFNGSITVVGQIAGHCAAVGVGSVTDKAYPLTTGAVALLTARGTGTGAAYSLLCPANQFVVGLTLKSGSALDQLNIQCAAVKLVMSGTAWVGEVGTATQITKGGGDGGAGPIAANCAAGQIATIMHARVIGGSTTATGLLSGAMIGCRAVTGK